MTLFYRNQEVADHLLHLLTSEIADYKQRLLELAYQTVRKRVADALLAYQRKFVEKDLPVEPRIIRLSRENWSHLVGASIESVIRTLSDFKNECPVSMHNSDIISLSTEKLVLLKH
ncbi:helix-turn-helix domain-containing protein [Spirosoma sp.]|uniref:helix-turn-helix domain-containing protein n=1 Tax=Spirosoma sp. TaxID=1899569 RepID=UPI00260DD44C|nr:helix-turn-helix domain-containing protein [Spirosoma sp.]MCX6215655.1 helix-turn-helix domain-containing protein [Spirosoma sp.]